MTTAQPAPERVCPGPHPPDSPPPALRPDEYLCARCVRRTLRRLEQLGADLVELDLTITRQSVGGNIVRQGHDRETPLFFNEHAAQVRTDALDRLREWAYYVDRWQRGRAPAPLDRRYRDTAIDLRRSIDKLTKHRDWLRSNDQGPVLADAIDYVSGRLRRAFDRIDPRWYAGQCGALLEVVDLVDVRGELVPHRYTTTCHLQLFAKTGQTEIVCDGYRQPGGSVQLIDGVWSEHGGCGAAHPALGRHKYVIKTLREKVLPLDAILSAMPSLVGRDPNPETVKKWRQRGKLQPVAQSVGSRRELFLGSDVLDLVIDKQPRPGRRRRDRGQLRHADDGTAGVVTLS